jgi:predicted nucleic acid-binding protein
VGSAVVDASVIIAALDPSDALHGSASAALREARRHRFILPVLAFAEVLVGAARGGAREERRAESKMLSIARVEPLTMGMARTGARLRSKHGLTLADALILATGIELKADVILTADRRWGRVDRRVKVLEDA